MRFVRRGRPSVPAVPVEALVRRAPRGSAFRSQDLVKTVRHELDDWFTAKGFKRLGGQAWTRAVGEIHQIVEIQCSQSGWDPRSGNQFIVEFEESREAARHTGYHRTRIWRTLAQGPRQDALAINRRVALTLPPPDPAFLSLVPAEALTWYQRRFSEPTTTTEDYDVWFRYYDETDAAAWATFLRQHVETAWSRFLEGAPEPPPRD